MYSFKHTFSVRALRCAAAALALLLVFALLPAGAFAAAQDPGFVFSGSVNGSKLTVGVTLSNPGLPLDSGMFLLDYDTSVLTATSSSVKAKSPASSSAVYFNAYYGCIGLDFHYPSRLAASDTAGAVAELTFTVKSGKKIGKLSDVLSVSQNTTYLKSIGGYQDDGGLLLCSGSSTRSAAQKNVTAEFILTGAAMVRLGGSDRFATANLIAGEGWGGSGSGNVVIASGLSFADALAGVPLAAALDAPILLVNKSSLPSSVKSELISLGATKIYILGGTAAISAGVSNSLASIAPVERIYGADRYRTAVAVAEKLSEVTGEKPSTAFLASSTSFPDALAVSPVAALSGCPILYAPKTGSLDSATADYLKATGCKNAVVLGGTAVVGASVMDSIAKAGGVGGVTRISGSDRYSTSLSICQKYSGLFEKGSVAVATGLSFPDALAGGALAAHLKMPLLLIDRGMVSADAKSFAASREPDRLYIFGGTNALSDATCRSLLS